MALKVTVSAAAGFCAGVQAAVKKAQEAAHQYGRVLMLGDIVHNEQVVSELSEMGVKVVENLDQIDQSTPVLFRSHGTPPAVWEAAQARGLIIIDATCPLVRQIHAEVRMLAAEGRRIIIIGDQNHEEVEGIASQVADPLIVSDPEAARQLPLMKKIGIVAQSTQTMENVAAIVAVLSTKGSDLRFINTICKPTRMRQEQIRDLARNNDVMLVVGSRKSANTRRLHEIAKRLNATTYLIEKAGDVQPEWFIGKTSVGVATGASTPLELVDAVVKKVGEYS
jgi:4-hydroxy-3-methylbut-2-enyl diphosphate reductase